MPLSESLPRFFRSLRVSRGEARGLRFFFFDFFARRSGRTALSGICKAFRRFFLAGFSSPFTMGRARFLHSRAGRLGVGFFLFPFWGGAFRGTLSERSSSEEASSFTAGGRSGS